MAQPKHKQPKFADLVEAVKQAKSKPAESFYTLNPAWRVSRMEMVDPYGWHQLYADKILEIRTKLGQFEGSTWKQIIVDSSKYHHFIPVTKICGEAQQRLRALALDDTDSLFSLRLSARERVWGILDNGVLLVLWWDPFHAVYPVDIANN